MNKILTAVSTILVAATMVAHEGSIVTWDISVTEELKQLAQSELSPAEKKAERAKIIAKAKEEGKTITALKWSRPDTPQEKAFQEALRKRAEEVKAKKASEEPKEVRQKASKEERELRREANNAAFREAFLHPVPQDIVGVDINGKTHYYLRPADGETNWICRGAIGVTHDGSAIYRRDLPIVGPASRIHIVWADGKSFDARYPEFGQTNVYEHTFDQKSHVPGFKYGGWQQVKIDDAGNIVGFETKVFDAPTKLSLALTEFNKRMRRPIEVEARERVMIRKRLSKERGVKWHSVPEADIDAELAKTRDARDPETIRQMEMANLSRRVSKKVSESLKARGARFSEVTEEDIGPELCKEIRDAIGAPEQEELEELIAKNERERMANLRAKAQAEGFTVIEPDPIGFKSMAERYPYRVINGGGTCAADREYAHKEEVRKRREARMKAREALKAGEKPGALITQ